MVRVSGLSFTYSNGAGEEIHVLNDVSLCVGSGDLVAIVGPSGCGKSTLLNVIAGFLQPHRGEVWVKGAPVAGAGTHCVLITQEQSLFPWMTVLDNVAFGLKARRYPRRERYAKARELLSLVQLQAFEQLYPHQLSGGMRQKVAGARALAVEPGIILLDEPFASLDWQSRQCMQDDLLRLWSSVSPTVLIVTPRSGRSRLPREFGPCAVGPPRYNLSKIRCVVGRPRVPEMRASFYASSS